MTVVFITVVAIVYMRFIVAVTLQIIVAGPVGCGKSECIKTFALAERERGKSIAIQSIFTKSMESNELLGHTDKHSRSVIVQLGYKFCF